MTPAELVELAALEALPDGQIDTVVIPEQRDWSGARRGVFFRPAREQLPVQIDADLVAWFKGRAAVGADYQTGLNQALRDYVVQHGRT